METFIALIALTSLFGALAAAFGVDSRDPEDRDWVDLERAARHS